MTREEFLRGAADALNDALREVRRCAMDLIGEAYAEGQKNAGADQVLEVVREALSRMEKPETASAKPQTCESWDPYIEEDGSVEMARCLSTPGLSLCNCGGDRSKCVFYGGKNEA